MARLKVPRVPEKPLPVVPPDTLRGLLDACDGKQHFEARRDTAILLLLDCPRLPDRRQPATRCSSCRPMLPSPPTAAVDRMDALGETRCNGT